MLRRLLAWLFPPVPCPRCGAPLTGDGGSMDNPARGPDGLPSAGSSLWTEYFRCAGCDGLLARVNRAHAQAAWVDRSTTPWTTLGPAD